MGPTGTPTETPGGETVLLAGGGLGNAVLFSIGQRLRAHGSRVIYFAGYKKIVDRYKVEEIEKAADVIVWGCDEPPGFVAARAAGQQLRRQHRAGDAGIRDWTAGVHSHSAQRDGPADRDRFGPHDAGGGSRPGTECSRRI